MEAVKIFSQIRDNSGGRISMRGIPKKCTTKRTFVSSSAVTVLTREPRFNVVDYFLIGFLADIETGNNFIPNPLFFDCACRPLLFLA